MGFGVGGRLDDIRVRRLGDSLASRCFMNFFRYFKNRGIDAAVGKEATGAVLFFQGANDFLQGMSENSPKRGAFVWRQRSVIFKLTGEFVTTVLQQHILSESARYAAVAVGPF